MSPLQTFYTRWAKIKYIEAILRLYCRNSTEDFQYAGQHAQDLEKRINELKVFKLVSLTSSSEEGQICQGNSEIVLRAWLCSLTKLEVIFKRGSYFAKVRGNALLY